MFLLDGVWVASATDLVGALRCEYQLLARRAEKAGLVAPLDTEEDQLMARAARLGDEHEARTLQQLRAEHGTGPDGVVSIERPSTKSRAELEAAHAETLAAMDAGARIVFQAAFFDGTFHGLADFLVRVPAPEGSDRPHAYEPADTKLARHAKVEALLQLASYGFQVEQMGYPAPAEAHLWLGDGTESSFRYGDLRPVYVDRTARLRELLDAPAAVPEWGTDDLRWCGWCDHCRAAADQRDDVLLVAGMRAEQRRTLAAAGIATIGDLARAAERPAGMKAATFEKLRAQAALQATQDATRTDADPTGEVTAEVADPAALDRLPAPNPGDVFFDFEGDPLHVAEGWGDPGLEYLWGILTHEPAAPAGQPGAGVDAYWPLWAHDRVAERQALELFIDWLSARRRQPGFEGLHVYHYAPYEITALKKLVQRYGTRGDELDDLLREGVFVDLYAVVRRGIRVSQRSYSIKKLEPLYMDVRDGEVTGGAESVVVYAEHRAALAEGESGRARAEELLEDLRRYNEEDCISTLGLRDWLLSLRGGASDSETPPASPTGAAEAEPGPEPEPEPTRSQVLAQALRAPVIDLAPADRTDEQQAVAMLGAALEYHRREVLPVWWDHFRRLAAPAEDWERDGEMIVIDPQRVTVTEPWHRPKSTWQRTFQAEVELPGSFKLAPSERQLFAIHEPPLAGYVATSETAERGYATTITLDAIEPRGGHALATFTQKLPMKVKEIDAITDRPPVAVAVADAREAKGHAKAILAFVEGLLDHHDTVDASTELPAHPAIDLLLRRPPRLHGGGGLPPLGDDPAAAIAAALRALDRSYLAVQGPPGTGKSTTGATAIAALVAEGWKVGVVAQSHRTIEALLEKVIEQGANPADVVKKESGDQRPSAWTQLTDPALHARATGPAGEGCLIGGTSWDFVNDNRVPAGSLDLLVIDEAGQFSLADTIAVARAAPRLLLLGDPQQLSQVSKALHPEPVHRAALDWLADGRDTLPERLGYFLPRTYRMHPALTRVVSHLSYDDRLVADPCAADRHLHGIEPGVQTVLVPHRDHRAAAPEEVDVVAGIVADLVGRSWTDPNDRARPGTRPLEPADIVVVAPFNAQVNRLCERLEVDGYAEVPVGTVDRFQGREAPVVIVSMAASSAAASPRGAGFLLSRHRLNVAISRAQHTAFLVHAPQLTEIVPGSPAGLLRLGSFLAVSHAGRAGRDG